jgi:hypothetical protein
MSGWTVQLLIDCEIAVTVRCVCQNAQQLNLATLKDKLGPDAQVMHGDLAPKLHCLKCGNRNVSLHYAPKATKQRVPHIRSDYGDAVARQ